MKKSENKYLRLKHAIEILNLIYAKKSIARVNLASLTGLNKATISSITKELIELDIIYESNFENSKGGRRPVTISAKTNIGYSISIDINAERTFIAILDFSSTAIKIEELQNTPKDFFAFYETLCESIDQILTHIPKSKYSLIGIGVSVHGVVDLNGNIKFFPELNWKNIELKNILEKKYKLPVIIDNDGNFSAKAEHTEFPMVSEMLIINIDDVITSSIISNKNIVRGFLGYANAIGHHVIDCHHKTPCTCGKSGCFEQFCSHKVILREINKYENIKTMEEFIELVREKNIHALSTLNNFLSYLSVGITNMIFMLNSEIIILNSPILEAFPNMLDDIKDRLILPITKTQEIYISKLQKKAPLIGASKMVIENFLIKLLSKNI